MERLEVRATGGTFSKKIPAKRHPQDLQDPQAEGRRTGVHTTKSKIQLSQEKQPRLLTGSRPPGQHECSSSSVKDGRTVRRTSGGCHGVQPPPSQWPQKAFRGDTSFKPGGAVCSPFGHQKASASAPGSSRYQRRNGTTIGLLVYIQNRVCRRPTTSRVELNLLRRQTA